MGGGGRGLFLGDDRDETDMGLDKVQAYRPPTLDSTTRGWGCA